MNPAPPLVESLEDRYASSCASLVTAVSFARRGRSWGWRTGSSIEELLSAFLPFLALHRRMPPNVALESFPLMLTVLLICSRNFGPGSGPDPYTLRQRDHDAVSQIFDSVRDRLAHLSALAADLEAGPPADDLRTYRSQYHGFPVLVELERKVARISHRLKHEMARQHPRAPVLLDAVLGMKDLLWDCVVPFWLVDFCGLPGRLVRLSHMCRRFVALEDERLWRHMRLSAVECLEGLYVAHGAGYEHKLLVDCLQRRTFHELKVSLPFFDRDSAFSQAGDAVFSGAFDPYAWERGSPPGPLDVWREYDSGLDEDERRLLATRVLAEFAAMSSYLASDHADVFRQYQHMIVEARDTDRYPFFPVDVHGPLSDTSDWNFDDFHSDENRLNIPDAGDLPARLNVERELVAHYGSNAARRIVEPFENRPAPDHGEPPAVDPA